MRLDSARSYRSGPRVIRPAARRVADTSDALDALGVDIVGSSGARPALPGRAPTTDEVAAIARAVFVSPLVALVPPERLQVTGIRISTGSPDWAFAALRPQDCDLDPAIVVLRFDVGGGWVLDQVGTAHVGVGRAPTPMIDEFQLDGGR
ncbi:hypothetical protein [Frankia sp. Cppng1_Ct_nod]|uniref:hypothetical protein n=1 Tax=Frankia sp. Cppng1_Ct_nod TaxID=2897162 RepID=UPI0010416019|nr:hypothetical protein [Frankia sp. Cppng1_Ct_nod]